MNVIIPDSLASDFLRWCQQQGYRLTYRPDRSVAVQTNANVVKFPRRHHQFIGAKLPGAPEPA